MIKKSSSNGSTPFNWEGLLNLIHSDSEKFKEAIERFQSQDKNFSPGYRLIYLNSQFARCARGTALLVQPEEGAFKLAAAFSRPQNEMVSQDFKCDITEGGIDLKQLQELFSQTDLMFSDSISFKEELELLFGEKGELWQRLTELETALKQFVEWSQSFKFDDEVYLEDLQQQGLDWILQFSEIYSVAHEPLKYFQEIESYTTWNSFFLQVERYFQSNFHCFSLLDEHWDKIRINEYQAPFWWLVDTPEAQIYENTEDGEELVSALGKVLQNVEDPVDCCPDFEMIVAYAHHDGLERSDLVAIRDHVYQCNVCLEHVLDIRASMQEAEQVQESPLYVSQKMWDLTLASMMKSHPERFVVPQKENALHFDPEVFPLYNDFAEPFSEALPMCHSTDDAPSKTVSGFVSWVKEHVEISRVRVNVHILFDEYQDGELTISGYLEETECHLVPGFAKWECNWETDSGQLLPDNFVHDCETGQFTAVFSMPERQEGRFVIRFVAQMRMNSSL